MHPQQDPCEQNVFDIDTLELIRCLEQEKDPQRRLELKTELERRLGRKWS